MNNNLKVLYNHLKIKNGKDFGTELARRSYAFLMLDLYY